MSKNPRILIVLTSHNQLGDTGKPTGFWLEEFASPYYMFVDAQAQVTLASVRGGEPPIDPKSNLLEFQTDATKRFMADEQGKKRLQNTLPLAGVNVADYDAIFFPGGHGPMWDFPQNQQLAKLIESFDRENKAIAAVCHGVVALVLVKSSKGEPIVKERKITAFTNSEERLVNLEAVVPFLLGTKLRDLGADFVAATDFTPHVQKDGNLITGQNPASSSAAAEQLLQLLKDTSTSMIGNS
jgi:putative intracellular protease/amidase